MSGIARSFAVLVALVLTGGGRAATLPSIYVDYGDDCTFTVSADGGMRLEGASAPGTTVPPGAYQVVLDAPQDAPSCPMHFRLSGPGVELEWEFGGEALDATATATLLPSSTYVAADLRDIARGRAVFTTSGSGSSSSLVPSPPTTAAPGRGQTLPGVVGSALLPFRGTLRATITDAGALTLSSRGRPVTSVKPGRYSLVVSDASRRRGLVLRRVGRRPASITSAGFVGVQTTAVTLARGTWVLAAGRVASKLAVG